MTPQAHLVAGLAYGDEGKGSIVDALVRKHHASLVVRYNGGAQAAHNVVTPDGRHHTFAQFGAGSFVPGVQTHLSQYMLVNPLNMMCEEEHLREVGVSDIWKRTTVDPKALIITPYQKATNRILEMLRGHSKHGSCGQGVGVTREHSLLHGDKVLFAADLKDEKLTKNKLEFIRKLCLKDIYAMKKVYEADTREAAVLFDNAVDWIWQQYKHWPAKIGKFAEVMDGVEHVVFEGAQGVLLDEIYGSAPFNTWSDTTFNNAHALLKDIGYNGQQTKIGVVRTYYTRHGVGPFPTEQDWLHKAIVPEIHNTTNEYQDDFRLGLFDTKQFGYAVKAVGGVDYVALNHNDLFSASIHIDTIKHFAPIGIMGFGPTAEGKKFAD